ncbi:hypothetical protein SLEP1_g3438 [Rubroshorea leprosula]|uniref:Uncharacterized protein n=1 Tax=Rubroshorea leprosula TaxID=152421 RepID=A0AAV5HU43_9ROSI|nr:hypothetical protein SLEP1_g3438 [Rubroshorea leprosula]
MDSPEHVKSYGRRERDDSSDVKSDRAGDDEEWEGSDKRKHRSSKPREPSNGEKADVLEDNGRRRSSGYRNKSRKRSSGLSRAEIDEDDYDTRKELRSKQMIKRKEERSMEILISWYQDGDLEKRQESGDKTGSRRHGRADESERRKTTSKFSEHESSCGERRESNRDKGHGSSDSARSSRKRWDEADAIKKDEDNHYERADSRSGNASDSKYENGRVRSASIEMKPVRVKAGNWIQIMVRVSNPVVGKREELMLRRSS